MMGEITISIEEYQYLLKMEASTRAFIDYVKRSKYSIDKEVCAAYLGFEVEDAGND